MKVRIMVPVVTGFALVAMAVAVQAANATHPRPMGATPFRVSLVIAYDPCTASTESHGPPLDSPSCNPPVQTSPNVTVGSPDANGAVANSVGFVRIGVCGPASATCSGTDFKVVVSVSDVRCKAGVTACGAANAVGGADYVGELGIGGANGVIRMTDHWNSVPMGGGPDPATMVDIPWGWTVPCAGTLVDSAIGSTCALTTSANTEVPGSVIAGKRASWELGQFGLIDGGPDGAIATSAGNTQFVRQGIFVP